MSSCTTNKTNNNLISKSEESDFVKNSLIIYFDQNIGNKELLKKVDEFGAKIDYNYTNINAIAITIPDNSNINDAQQYFSKVKGVNSVSKNYINQLNKVN